ncbi:hypothetical protein COO60DRAFT_1549812 [Scenedesmus sp. NREL 46B-D3]|nr:hypothetical protein COO60DRAFT_1549812 [Scenedesmus sp. NREL 46B-D3]
MHATLTPALAPVALLRLAPITHAFIGASLRSMKFKQADLKPTGRSRQRPRCSAATSTASWLNDACPGCLHATTTLKLAQRGSTRSRKLAKPLQAAAALIWLDAPPYDMFEGLGTNC